VIGARCHSRPEPLVEDPAPGPAADVLAIAAGAPRRVASPERPRRAQSPTPLTWRTVMTTLRAASPPSLIAGMS
jgi:hypothetical protein